MKNTTTNPEPMLRISFSSPQREISAVEQTERQYLSAAMETLIASFEARFHTTVDEIEMYPCDCEECMAAG